MTWLRISFLLSFVAAGIGHARVTVAWKMTAEPMGIESSGLTVALSKNPGESAFFLPGDKLYDLSPDLNRLHQEKAKGEAESDPFEEPGVPEKGSGWKGDWAVWNSRSGMVVARGSWNDMFSAEKILKFRDSPLVARTRFDLVRAVDPRSISLVSRSGEKAELELHGLQVETEVTLGSAESSVIDCPLKISWPADGNQAGWELRTAVSVREGARFRVARHGVGESAWELFVSFDRELPDGSRWAEARSIESEKGVSFWPIQHGHSLPVCRQLGPDRWIGSYQTDADYIMQNLARSGEEVAGEIMPSEEVSEWVRGSLVDIQKFLEDQGLRIRGPGNFAGLDPVSQRVFVVTDQVNQNLAAMMFDNVLDCCGDAMIRIETNPESGGWGLACRSGEKAEIRRAAGTIPGSDLLFQIEPTRSGSGRDFDLRYDLNVVSGVTKAGRLVSATTLLKGQPQVIGSGSGTDGKDVQVVVTATDG